MQMFESENSLWQLVQHEKQKSLDLCKKIEELEGNFLFREISILLFLFLPFCFSFPLGDFFLFLRIAFLSHYFSKLANINRPRAVALSKRQAPSTKLDYSSSAQKALITPVRTFLSCLLKFNRKKGLRLSQSLNGKKIVSLQPKERSRMRKKSEVLKFPLVSLLFLFFEFFYQSFLQSFSSFFAFLLSFFFFSIFFINIFPPSLE